MISFKRTPGPPGVSFLLVFSNHLRYNNCKRERGIGVKALLKKYKELILYVFFGGLTTLVNWGMYWLLNDVLQIHYLWATALAYISSVLFAYVTNRIWVFESKVRGLKGILAEMGKFFLGRGATFLLDLLCMYIGVDLLRVNDKLMKLLSNVIVIVVNYILSKLFIFRKKES